MELERSQCVNKTVVSGEGFGFVVSTLWDKPNLHKRDRCHLKQTAMRLLMLDLFVTYIVMCMLGASRLRGISGVYGALCSFNYLSLFIVALPSISYVHMPPISFLLHIFCCWISTYNVLVWLILMWFCDPLCVFKKKLESSKQIKYNCLSLCFGICAMSTGAPFSPALHSMLLQTQYGIMH